MSTAITQTHITCSKCKVSDAEIFSINGDYCVQCWQDLSYRK